MANSQFITLAVLVCVLGVGIMLGRFAKPTGLNKLRYQLKEAEIQTRIDEERLKQDDMIRERMQ